MNRFPASLREVSLKSYKDEMAIWTTQLRTQDALDISNLQKEMKHQKEDLARLRESLLQGYPAHVLSHVLPFLLGLSGECQSL